MKPFETVSILSTVGRRKILSYFRQDFSFIESNAEKADSQRNKYKARLDNRSAAELTESGAFHAQLELNVFGIQSNRPECFIQQKTPDFSGIQEL